ncbi:hypothetical protein Q4E93_05680 [Flavitalea sp. BT771]|uniref:hypothetical protein n=1 Tax=Flavitalea sp. BT771 TaxID=3063329 RepID=UPI0026E2CE99|nr:hypothetical protein [Flavitalea sp. BT771]MDO6430064.1 hypothetical protein [Flavitalea sp. BT771]MDV6219797.1 hypothetical protein [Flavitalea sp. BT771]
MKKIFRKIAMGALILAPLMFAPHISKANIISDLVHWLKGDKDDKGDKGDKRERKEKDRDSSGNSVPVNGGVVFLVVAGLGLGTKMLYDYNKKGKTEPTSI